ncbi:hypothetical protein SAY86_030461 [Trapa natans]|uniref:Thymidine kinase n=1 Tax=Trapa natans TaxID=22666 RepID=A0AAN7M2X2_TRANT|nr:hypothetical protein SAY86_030461 [Trapa natans]
MLSFLRINSLWSPTFSAFSPHFSKPSYPVAFISLSSSHPIFCKSLRNPDFHQFNPYQCQSKCSNLSPQARTLHVNGSGLSIGEIHVILGPMFAGKTSSLLQRIESESCNGRKVAVIKSNKDTRYGLDSIVTHDGAKFQCMALANLSSFKQMFGADAYDELDVIGIDEAQFFEDLYDFCQEAADRDGKIVVVAGLDGDYLRLLCTM